MSYKAVRESHPDEITDNKTFNDLSADYVVWAMENDAIIIKALKLAEALEQGKFQMGDRVQKVKGSNWHGKVVGFYTTELTPIGYAVESELEKGSVQIYPEAALNAAKQRD